MPTLDPAQLLAEFEDLIRTMPPRPTLRHQTDENFAWLGRAGALVAEWSVPKTVLFSAHMRALHGLDGHAAAAAVAGMMLMLQEARHSLRLSAVGPLSIGIEKGNVFDYYDGIRKLIEGAKSDVFFVDPFLDADFVARYLPHVSPAVSVRLLARKHLAVLVPAAQLFAQQHGLSIEVRASQSIHDRFVFIDKQECYLSGASFKDGARLSPTAVTQIIDGFAAMQSIYEPLWQTGTPQQG